MNVIKTSLKDVVIIEPEIFIDERGYFMESFSDQEFSKKVRTINFIQDNESMSTYGVIRGLHFQCPPFTQSKLIWCIEGTILDVVVDIRKGSPTFGKFVAEVLSSENHHQLFIPRGFAHGFSVLSATARIQYKCDSFYHPEAEGGLSVLDKSLGIDWGIPADKAILSEKDKKLKFFNDFNSPFDVNIDLYK